MLIWTTALKLESLESSTANLNDSITNLDHGATKLSSRISTASVPCVPMDINQPMTVLSSVCGLSLVKV